MDTESRSAIEAGSPASVSAQERVDVRKHQIVCRLCRSDDVVPHLTKHVGEQPYAIVKCRGCTAEFLYPLPSVEAVMDAQQHYFDQSDAALENPEQNRRYWVRERRQINRLGYERGRVLDIGCNAGHFLDALGPEWEKHGVEVADRPAQIARSKGIRVNTEEGAESLYPDHHFDLVTMYALIEHVPDPVSTISNVARVLRPGGMLVLMTGAANSLKARLKGSDWHMYCPPIHSYFFTERALRGLLGREGLKPIYRKYTSGGMPWADDRSTAGRIACAFERRIKQLIEGAPFSKLPFYDHLYIYAVRQPVDPRATAARSKE